MHKKTAILLVNLGSPDAPNLSAVKRYLRQFLSDKHVVKIPSLLWKPLLNIAIIPFKLNKITNSYQKIWTAKGSPLIAITAELSKTFNASNNNDYLVDYAMRYGHPTIRHKLRQLKENNVESFIILPLYPQYSQTTTASVFDLVINEFNKWKAIPEFKFINDYHQHCTYIEAISDSISHFWNNKGKGQKLLISFHGLPENSKKIGDPYFKQCHRTAKLIANKLSLDEQDWQLVFQSRFGRTQWLKPYCIKVLKNLPKQGIKKVDIICPGFPIDCLETLEEIAITNKAEFIKVGGDEYNYIPALNATKAHAQSLYKVTINSST